MVTQNALWKHVEKHNALMPIDIIKFLYQAELGCGHLIPDFAEAHERFCAEWDNATYNGEDVFESLGGGFCRINLGAAKAADLSQSMVLRMFFESAFVCKSKEHLERQLELTLEAADNGKLPFSKDALRAEIDSFKNANMPLVSHSEQYRAAYSPSYRVVKAEFCFYLPIFDCIFKLLRKKSAPLIVIDGMAASGKSTLSALITSIVPCNLIHADSFFLVPELRVPARTAALGGLLHYERLRQDVLVNLGKGQDFTYQVFDCQTMSFTDEMRVVAALPSILEGSYSTHRELNASPDVTVFLKTCADTQAARILQRSGKSLYTRFVSEWIPAENAFFAYNNTEKNSDFVFET